MDRWYVHYAHVHTAPYHQRILHQGSGAYPRHGNFGPLVIDKNQPIRKLVNTNIQMNPVVNISDLGKGPCRVKG